MKATRLLGYPAPRLLGRAAELPRLLLGVRRLENPWRPRPAVGRRIAFHLERFRIRERPRASAPGGLALPRHAGRRVRVDVPSRGHRTAPDLADAREVRADHQ